MPRLTGRGFALLGLAVATYLAGRVVGTWELYLFAFAFLAAVIISWLLVVATGRRIRVIRSMTPERPTAGEEPEMGFLIENASILPGPHVTLQNRLLALSPQDLQVEIESLAPRTERTLKSHFGAVNRGVYVLPPAQVRAEDPLGIAGSVHRAGDPLPVTVYPRITLLDSCALYPEMGLRHDWGGRRGLPSPGASEFKGVRQHQPGEPLSRIDWKSTARTGVLMLREMEEPAGADITLLLDGTAQQVRGEPPHSNFELAVRAAGSVADFALRAGRGVTLQRHERRWRQTRLTADGGGRRSLLELLAEARPDAPAPLTTALRHLQVDGRGLLYAQNVTVVSLSLDRQLVQSLIGLREQGLRLSLLYVMGAFFAPHKTQATPDSDSSILPFLPPHDQLQEGLPMEAKAFLLALSSAGIPCLTLGLGDDLSRSLAHWSTGRRRTGASWQRSASSGQPR